jgi:NAD dependent epimerase/dehydratase family enzyme
LFKLSKQTLNNFPLQKNILITGGTGLIGSAIIKLLKEKAYEVAVLSRRKNLKDLKSFYWNYETNELDPEAIKFADVIIHLAGENLSAKRWSPNQKQKILNSRVKSTQLLFESTKKSSHKPTKIISA